MHGFDLLIEVSRYKKSLQVGVCKPRLKIQFELFK